MDHVMNDPGMALECAAGTVSAIGSNVPQLFNEGATLSALWTELVSGFCKIEEVSFTERSCSVVVSRSHRLSTAAGTSALSARDIEILERALIEGIRKSVAADFGLCASSVAEILRRCFACMGLSCWPSRIPLLLVIAAHAKRGADSQRGARSVLAQNQQYVRQTISAARPDNELAASLSPAEYSVTRLLIEGKSYAEMAVLRKTSKRTVANQLAAAFHRLHVSGRADLLCLLARRKVSHWQALASAPARAVAPPTDVAPVSTRFALAAGQRNHGF